MNSGLRKAQSLFLPAKQTTSFLATHRLPLLPLKTSVAFGSLVSVLPIKTCCTLPEREEKLILRWLKTVVRVETQQ